MSDLVPPNNRPWPASTDQASDIANILQSETYPSLWPALINRYATTALRDADLAGLGSADIAFAWVDALTRMTYWDGTAWRQLGGPTVTIAGSTVTVTSAGGDASVSFGVTFTAAPVVVVCNGDNSAHGNMSTSINGIGSTTTTGTTVRCITANTAATIASASVRLNWTATGILA